MISEQCILQSKYLLMSFDIFLFIIILLIIPAEKFENELINVENGLERSDKLVGM